MTNYRRTSKPKTEHIKKGFTVFQKTVATIGSIHGLITASITIKNVKEEKREEQKAATQESTTPAPSKPTTENEKQSNTPTSENKTNQ